MPVTTAPLPSTDVFDDDDDGWQDMPVVREDNLNTDLDEEDRKKYHYQPSSNQTKSRPTANATGTLIDVDDMGYDWRSKVDQNESEYTRLRMQEEDETDEVALRTRYLFDEDKAMTPLSQMQATKKLLTEAQRIAYVGLCALTAREMAQELRTYQRKELKASVANLELWSLKIMGRLYYHMELETQEQRMIENLAEHGVQAIDLVPSLMTTHTVANPEYDPEEARRRRDDMATPQTEKQVPSVPDLPPDDDEGVSISDQTLVEEPIDHPTPDPSSKVPPTPTSSHTFESANTTSNPTQTVTKVLNDTTMHMPGVTTSLSSADEKVTLDIRWTILCDLFLILIADSVYDARSRVLLERVAQKLGLGWIDVVRFESRVTEALEIQEGIEKLEQQEIVDGVQKAGRKRRYMMMGLATLGGGLVIGLSAGLLAPVIGVGLGAAFSAIGISGTTAFLGGTAGAAAITTGGVLTGSTIAARGMAKRTREVRTFDILPLHNNKRVSCILTVPGFMNGANDDVRLPFSVLDPVVGDVFSVLWEPEMIRETGSALKIMTAEVLSQIGLTVLQATAMTALMSALQWPIILTKLGYLIDNPWSNALDRAKAAGRVLADVLIQRHLGVRPITLIGFSLGARVIFYALLELAKQKAFGIVQDVILLGATLTASQTAWCQTRSAVSGRYINGFAKNDWVLNYLFRATSGGVGTVAGLRPVKDVPGLENVDVTDKISGHMSYRTFMPLILDQLGFPVSADFFNEPEEPEFTEDRIVVREEEQQKKKGWFSRRKPKATPQQHVSRPPSSATFAKYKPNKANSANPGSADDDDLPPRMDSPAATRTPMPHADATEAEGDIGLHGTSRTPTPVPQPMQVSEGPKSSISVGKGAEDEEIAHIPKHAGFDLEGMRKMIGEATRNPVELAIPPVHTSASQTRLTPPPSPKVDLGHQRMPERVGSKDAGLSGSNAQGRSASWSYSTVDNKGEEKGDELEERFQRNVSFGGQDNLMSSSFAGSSLSALAALSPPVTTYKPPVELVFGNEREEFSWGAPLSATSFNVGDDISYNPFTSPKTGGSNNDGFGAYTDNNGVGGTNAGISFGSIDGSITTGADAWTISDGGLGVGSMPAMPSSGKKSLTSAPSALSFGTNPWS